MSGNSQPKNSIALDGPCLVVAEVSANHNGSFERAAEIIRAAKEAGADAVKLQTYTADTLTLDCDRPPFQISGGTLWDGQTLYDLYKKAYTPWSWQPKLKELADGIGIPLFSTPFDRTAVDFLEEMDVPLYKIASLELGDDDLLARVADTRKPVLLATGVSNAEEIEHALETLDKHDSGEVILLHCVSDYPARPSEMNIRTIPDMAKRFGRRVGLSDHSMTNTAAVGAVALGACVVEKHFTLSRNDAGPDSGFSLESVELRELVKSIRDMETVLGEPSYGPTAGESASLMFRRSLYVVADVKAGEEFSSYNIRAIRPGGGLFPRYLQNVLGKRATRDILRGTPLAWDLLTEG